MHARLTTCVLSIAGCALLAIPARPAAQDNQDHIPTMSFAREQTNVTFPLVSLNGTNSAATCTLAARPCNPKAPTCCPGLRCVFHGGSTRIGYMCLGSAKGLSWELSENKLDGGL